MTSPPGQDPTREALILAEKALAPFDALRSIIEAAHRKMDPTSPPASDDVPAHFNVSLGMLRGATKALAVIRAAQPADAPVQRRYEEYGDKPGEYHGLMKPKAPSPIPGLSSPQGQAAEEGRCEICGWPFAASRELGCAPGDCSYRPDNGSPEWHRIQERRAALAKAKAQPSPEEAPAPAGMARRLAQKIVRALMPTDDNDSMCRDCADEDGICPRSGVVCDSVGVVTAILLSQPSAPTADTGSGEGLQWEIEKAFRLFYGLTFTPDADKALSTLRHEMRNVARPNRPFDEREFLGRVVREAWIAWAQGQPNPKPTWLVPYDKLAEADKEADRQIGEAVILLSAVRPKDGGAA